MHIPFPSEPTVVRAPGDGAVLDAREHRQVGVRMEKARVVIGAGEKTLVVEAAEAVRKDDTEVRVSLVRGRTRRSTVARMQLGHMLGHCAAYKKQEKAYVKHLRECLQQDKVDIVVDLHSDTSDVYVEI